jgi:hypothetical protein
MLNKYNYDPFALIRMLPESPPFLNAPTRPEDSTILAAEKYYLMFEDEPTCVISYDKKVILEWHYPSRRKSEIYKELIFHNANDIEWNYYK